MALSIKKLRAGGAHFHFLNLEQYQRRKSGDLSNLSYALSEDRNLPATHARCVEIFFYVSRFAHELSPFFIEGGYGVHFSSFSDLSDALSEDRNLPAPHAHCVEQKKKFLSLRLIFLVDIKFPEVPYSFRLVGPVRPQHVLRCTRHTPEMRANRRMSS